MGTIYVIRGLIAVLLAALGVVQLASGRVVIGVLFIALAIANVALLVTMRRRRADLVRRYPRLAEDAGRRPPRA
jgi:hypothetical protein